MESHKINPILSNTLNVLIPKFLFPIKEYQKDNLTETSYIFTPNHTNNLDGYVIWCLLSKYYDIEFVKMIRQMKNSFMSSIAPILVEIDPEHVQRYNDTFDNNMKFVIKKNNTWITYKE